MVIFDDDHWHLAIGGEAVGFVDAHGVRLGDDALTGDDSAQCCCDLLAATDNGQIRLRHLHIVLPCLSAQDRAVGHREQSDAIISSRNIRFGKTELFFEA